MDDVRRSESRFRAMSYQEKMDTYQALRLEEYEEVHSKFSRYITYGLIVLGLLSLFGLAIFLVPDLLNVKVVVLFILAALGGMALIVVGYKGVSAVNEEYADDLESAE